MAMRRSSRSRAEAPVGRAAGLVLAVCLSTCALAGTAGAWQPGVHAAIAYAHTRAGTVSFEVRTEHGSWGWRATRTVPSASVLKAMLLVAYL
ncbi:MAG TPA: hypothetical protein VMB05_07010, partial [Solirubrobacteraceae bacterium]|nr:hypothetical protein [Solirubrobacteraceae bacterium]